MIGLFPSYTLEEIERPFVNLGIGTSALELELELIQQNQLAHDVVTTLDFGCILVAMSDNVVPTLSQRCVSDVVTTTKN